ncbi:hypothetical protein EXE51_11275 [Halorubrum sp. CGM5_25_10-8B]|uniref:hypothetical protein n=1 Tax=Halorubrum sp. CGM5_25_10-8B TaxID=2518115 RepID=UPI0010F751C1|nr:hypothetical protein [Halorubrum sp. CGM5_25_10-8B]TKX36371.1 hypothetical protein EXE51_11275 [Halorubrum sp. CGM5_25_10-8B]
MTRTDRQNAILTDEQRKTLLGISDIERTGSHKRNFETDLRKRIRSGIHDFYELRKIGQRDLRLIFDRQFLESDGVNGNIKRGDLPEASEPEFRDTANQYIAVTHMVAFAWRGLRAIGNEPKDIIDNAIMEGVSNGEADYRGISRSLVGVDLDFDLEVHSDAALDPLEKWERDLPLKTAERTELHEQLIEAVPEEVYQSSTPVDFDDLVEEYLASEE